MLAMTINTTHIQNLGTLNSAEKKKIIKTIREAASSGVGGGGDASSVNGLKFVLLEDLGDFPEEPDPSTIYLIPQDF